MTLDPAFVYLCWGTPIFVQSVIAAVLFARKVHRTLPCFFAYTCYVVVTSCAQVAMHPSAQSYFPSYSVFFYSFWAEDAIAILLGLMVIAELFDKVFESYEGLRHLGTMLFRWGALVMVLLALATTASLPNHDPIGIIGTVFVVERGLRVVQIGLLAFLFLFCSYFGLRLRDLSFGIALGFGIYATVVVAASAASSHYGNQAYWIVSNFPPIAYNCSVLVWAAYIFRRETVPHTERRLPPTEVHRWNHALLELMHR